MGDECAYLGNGRSHGLGVALPLLGDGGLGFGCGGSKGLRHRLALHVHLGIATAPALLDKKWEDEVDCCVGMRALQAVVNYIKIRGNCI